MNRVRDGKRLQRLSLHTFIILFLLTACQEGQLSPSANTSHSSEIRPTPFPTISPVYFEPAPSLDPSLFSTPSPVPTPTVLPTGTVEIKIANGSTYYCEPPEPNPKLRFPTDLAVTPDGKTVYAINSACSNAWSLTLERDLLTECAKLPLKNPLLLKQHVIFLLRQQAEPEILLKDNSRLSCLMGTELEIDSAHNLYLNNEKEAAIIKLNPALEASILTEIREKNRAYNHGSPKPPQPDFSAPYAMQIQKDELHFAISADGTFDDYRLRKKNLLTGALSESLTASFVFSLANHYNYTFYQGKPFILTVPGFDGEPFSSMPLQLIEYQNLPVDITNPLPGSERIIPIKQTPQIKIHPHNLRTDSKGVFYLSDPLNHVIWKIELASDRSQAEMRILAGSGKKGLQDGQGESANFNVPTALSLDQADNLYVADTANHAIRKITPSGEVTTFYKNP